MKTKLICTIFIILFFLQSCKKNEPSILDKREIAELIANQKSFNNFTKNFIVNLSLIGRLNSNASSNAQLSTLNENVKTTNEADSLSFEKSMIVKNRLDNQCLALLHQNPILIGMDSAVVEEILINAVDIKLAMTDVETLTMKEETNKMLNTTLNGELTTIINSVSTNTETKVATLTIDEVWDCAKRAIGIGAGSILTIAGLQKLATEGIQEIAIITSKWLAKRAGWVGAAIILFDFSSCLYAESHD